MMALGTPAAIRRTETSVVAALNETIRLLTPVMPRQVCIQVDDRTQGIDQVLADPNLLQQVLLNLLVRARDSMRGGGSISIQVDRLLRDGQGSDVRVVVADTGAGIPPEELPHAFDPFHTRSESGTGSGLALALVRSFVDSCGGRIQVRSPAGSGAVFTMTLPGAESSRSRPVATKCLVVLGEGHPLLRPMLAEVLQQSGYEVLAPEALPEFRRALGAFANRKGAVVVDGAFVGLSPEETKKMVASQAGRSVPIIMAAANPGEAGLETDGLTVISRPIDIELLRQRLLATLVDSAGP
jgi:hypothetical protein